MTPAETERLKVLHDYAILDTPKEAAFDRVTALAAELFDTPIALISFVDKDRQWLKSTFGIDATQTRREHAFCDHTIRSDEVLVVPDAMEDDRFAANPYVTGSPDIRFYAGAPLRLENGLRLGALCVIDRKPRKGLSPLERKRLRTLAQIVVTEMDLRLTTERLELARRQAEAASAAKSEFLANMSHEVRTPLTSIIGYAGLLSASPDLAERDRRFVERIRSASGNLLTIVNDILDLARLEAGELEVTVEAIDARPVLQGAAELVAEQAAAKGLELKVICGEEPALTLADAARLRQVALNLLANAVKFTEAGAVTAAVSRRDGMVEVAITDTGVGIPPDRLEQVFERFVQADNSVARKFGGTGLGLAICRRLLDRMRGEITAESVVGQGSTFRVRLPAAG